MKRRCIAIVAIVLILAAGWTWRYVTMNAYFDSLTLDETEIYQIGEIVPFEDDLGNMSVNLNGYSLRVDRFEVQDFDTYIDTIDFEMDGSYYPGEKVALVYITLFNEDSEAEGVMLTDFRLQGVDNPIEMDWDLLIAANPVLEGNFGLRLSPDTQYSIVLPYKMQEEYFGKWTWNHFEDYELFFRMTIYPTKKIIQVQ